MRVAWKARPRDHPFTPSDARAHLDGGALERRLELREEIAQDGETAIPEGRVVDREAQPAERHVGRLAASAGGRGSCQTSDFGRLRKLPPVVRTTDCPDYRHVVLTGVSVRSRSRRG